MMHHRRANRIKACDIRVRRPGIIKAFMQPTKLRNQVKPGSPETRLKFSPRGKTLVGGTQWAINIQRPGLAAPLIIAKQEQQAMAKVAKTSPKAAAAIAKAKAKALSGWHF